MPPNGSAYIFQANPVIPVTVGDWNLISRALLPIVASVDGYIEGLPGIPEGAQSSNRETGIGDINYSLFLSPADANKFIWGVGPSIMLPTATEKVLGSGKWSIDPTSVILFQPDWRTIGGLIRQLWSVGENSEQSSVNQTLIEPFLNYNLDDGWYLIADPIMTCNWQTKSRKRWTIPLGGGLGRLFMIGDQPINMRLEGYYNVVRPTSAPDWQAVLTVQFLFLK